MLGRVLGRVLSWCVGQTELHKLTGSDDTTLCEFLMSLHSAAEVRPGPIRPAAATWRADQATESGRQGAALEVRAGPAAVCVDWVPCW